MAYDELELDRIGDRKTAVFFIISDTTQTYNFLVALAFSQMFNLLCERADNVHGGRLPHHVRVLWDEAANTGQVPQLEKIVAVIRSREISLTLFYQQLAQCKAIYDKHAETILGNMDSVIFLGGREASTIKEISENWLGKATISMQTDSRSRGQSESYSQNNQRLGRELMTPSELATMPGDKCILQLRGLPPFYSPKYDLKKHPNYRYTAEADKKKNAFDLDRLINRKRRPGPDELCEVYAVAVPDDGLTSEDEDILNYPSYLLTNNNANIRRTRQRIEDLKSQSEYAGWAFPGGRAEINEGENRLQLFFEEKPSEEQRRELKSNGFKWAPSQGAWQRQLTKNAIYAAGRMEFLRPEDGQSPYQLQPFARKTEKDMTR